MTRNVCFEALGLELTLLQIFAFCRSAVAEGFTNSRVISYRAPDVWLSHGMHCFTGLLVNSVFPQ